MPEKPLKRAGQLLNPLKKAGAKSILVVGQVWRNIDIRKPESWLSTLVNLLIRLSTLALMITLAVLLWRIFRNEGFSIEPFSMPKKWEENGFTGEAMARQLLDSYEHIKSIGFSVKADNLQAEGPDNAELNVAVMGFGISLRSVAFHLRELVGRPNLMVRTEIMQTDSSLLLKLRMSGHPTVSFQEKIGSNAEKTLEKLIEKAAQAVLNNTDPYRLALYLSRIMAYSEANKVLNDMYKNQPADRHWALFGQGVLADYQGDFNTAIRYLNQTLSIKPDFTLAYQRLAGIYNRKQQFKEVLYYSEKSHQYNPSDSSSLSAMGQVYHYFKRYKESDAAFAKMAKLTHNNPVWLFNWVNCLNQRGEQTKAIQLLQEKTKQLKDSSHIYWLNAYVFEMQEDSAKSIQSYEKALTVNPYNVYLRATMIQIYFAKGNFERIVELGTDAILSLKLDEEDPKLQEIWNYTSMAYNYMGNSTEAFKWIQKSIDVNPAIGYPYSSLAEIHGVLGQVDLFYQWLEKAFVLGFQTGNIDPSLEPYKSIAKEKKYKDLIQKYSQ